MQEETKEALELIYQKMCEKLEERHRRYCNQNWAMRGMELAKSQIESKGDTYVDYALELLDGGYKRLKGINEKECRDLYCYKAFVWEFVRTAEEIADIKFDRKTFDDAMNAMDNPRKLPPLPFQV